MGIDLENTNFNFLDLETTGFSSKNDRVIEVYATKVQNGRIIESFHSLVNPKMQIPRDIVYLTAIPVTDLQMAPTFDQISAKLMSLLGDDVIVAHNARFDIGFLRSEFARLGMSFKNQYCCTVKISRYLYPQYKKHGLSHIIQRLGIDEEFIAGSETGRHRADYDTEVIKVFFYKSLERFGSEKFKEAVEKAMKTKSKPSNMLNFDFDKIPSGPGVYLFYADKSNTAYKKDTTKVSDFNDSVDIINYGDNYGVNSVINLERVPLYIGMSKDLKRRVFEHLYSSTTYEKDFDITNQVKEIKIIPTAGILGAKLRESYLVKALKPIYNKKLRLNTENCKYKIIEDKNGYYNLVPTKKNIIQVEEVDKNVDLIGGEKFIKLMLNEYIKKFGLCARLLGLEKAASRKGDNRPCFYYHLNQCKGACVKEIAPDQYNLLFKEAFSRYMIESWPYNGQIELIESKEGLATNKSQKSNFNEPVLDSETFYINNWCLLGSSKDDLPKQSQKVEFDRDVYQILKSHLK